MFYSYKNRKIVFIDTLKSDSWKFKLYGVFYQEQSEDNNRVIELGKEIVKKNFPVKNEENYGVGFAGIHCGKDADLIFICWWQNENELFSKVFTSDKEILKFKENTSGVLGCVWDLMIINYERNAWVQHVLNKKKMDFSSYLKDVYV